MGRLAPAAAAAAAQGRSFPLGPTLRAGGANFSVFAKHATALELLLFDRVDDAVPVGPRSVVLLIARAN